MAAGSGIALLLTCFPSSRSTRNLTFFWAFVNRKGPMKAKKKISFSITIYLFGTSDEKLLNYKC